MLNKDHFVKVLDDILHQVFEGKGDERHGHGNPFENQPWKLITDNVGTGFVIGQSLKKLMELKAFSSSNVDEKLDTVAYKAWRREAIGAVVYIIMGIMYRDMVNNKPSEPS